MRLVVLSTLLTVLPACSQTASPNGAQSAAGQSSLQRRTHAAPQYVLGTGDQFVLHVQDLEEITDKPVRVDPGGFVDLPLAGRIEVAGLTLEEFKAQLAGKLSKYINSPSISINLLESGNEPVSVVGEVNNPGVHQLSGSRRLLEVLSLSGGLKPDAGPRVIVSREPRWGAIDAPHTSIDPVTKYSTASFSVDSLMAFKNPDDNIMIEPNDVISVPRADLVYIVGQVRKAGGFQISTHESISLIQAVSMAEGLASDNSASHAHILRPTGDGPARDIPVNVNRIFAGKDPDVPLFANDVLFIPHSGAKVASRRALEAAIGVTTGLLIYRP